MKKVSNELFTYFTNHYTDDMTPDKFWDDVIAGVSYIVGKYKESDAYGYAVKYGSTIITEFQRIYKRRNSDE